MAILTQLTAGLLVASTLLASSASAALESGNQFPARHLKHPQPRARAHGHHASKRATADTTTKKKVCSAKKKAVDVQPKVDPPKDDPKPDNDTKKDDGDDKDSGNNSSSGGGKPAPGGSGKAGLGWNNGPHTSMDPYMATGKVSWYYTWSAWKACSGDNCPTFCPMFWGREKTSEWYQNVDYDNPPKCALFVNEPDQDGQSNMSVGEAISLWRKILQPLNTFRVSPAVTMSPAGLQWLSDFIDQCDGCNIGAYALHWYGLNADDFISAVTKFHNQHPEKPIWITEWANHNYGPNPDQQHNLGQIQDFMAQTLAFVDNTPWIQKHAWFGCLKQMPPVTFNSLNRIMTPGGQINDLGRQYIAW